MKLHQMFGTVVDSPKRNIKGRGALRNQKSRGQILNIATHFITWNANADSVSAAKPGRRLTRILQGEWGRMGSGQSYRSGQIGDKEGMKRLSRTDQGKRANEFPSTLWGDADIEKAAVFLFRWANSNGMYGGLWRDRVAAKG